MLDIFCGVKHEKVLIFSQWIRIIDIIEAFIKSKGWEFRKLTGETPPHNRMAIVDEFNEQPRILLFLATTKTGGLGLNLKSASKGFVSCL